MLMIGIPVGSILIKFNLGALFHSIGERLPNEWIPDNALQSKYFSAKVPEVAHTEHHNHLINGGKESPAIGKMSLMSALVTNQNLISEEGADQQATLKNRAL
ncbi:hypothetical protein DSO57_1027987 [Entomophthora muscae]|uniref:Uncharacterized protein n=1 Tax=Entomophthora muscae TaxID=34485 RepID=A0ACC2S3N8_9FUNG|nr:hypothetical protein DSO57_1027987 [Entomophthora muscae]